MIKETRIQFSVSEAQTECHMSKEISRVNEQKEEVMKACIEAFNEKGLKFTMDDVAAICHMSKKTMYVLFSDKEALFLEMVDFVFDKVKECEAQVLNNSKLSTVEKIRKIMGVLPEGYAEVDFAQLYFLKDRFPHIYEKVEKRLETGWEPTISLIEQGQREGVIKKNVHIPLVKLMLESSLEHFFVRDVLIENKIAYKTALDEVVNIIIDGIAV